MRKLAAALCLFFWAFAGNAQTAQPNTDPTTAAAGAVFAVHVVSAHVTRCETISCFDPLYVEGLIDGKKYEFGGIATGGRKEFGQDVGAALLPPGDYRVKLTKSLHARSGMIYQEYEFLFSDGSTWKCVLMGLSE